MPLLLKGYLFYILIVCVKEYFVYLDTTFISEGNETYIDGLVNFEKMVSTFVLFR